MAATATCDSSLWDYALTHYQRPGVAAACLAMQDRFDADVNLLLTAAWLAARCRVWQTADVEALVGLCAEWRARCLLPLRAVRRYLRERIDADDTEADALRILYGQGKSLELEAERHQLRLIEGAAAALSGAREKDGLSLLAINLDRYLATLAADADQYGAERDLLLAALSDEG